MSLALAGWERCAGLRIGQCPIRVIGKVPVTGQTACEMLARQRMGVDGTRTPQVDQTTDEQASPWPRPRSEFGITSIQLGPRFRGERACKRRPAKHLEFLPFLLEGRRSIQLSYGRAVYALHSKTVSRTSAFGASAPKLAALDVPPT
jgi:hypothetical protein